jgi:hypothetical protein
MEINKPLEDRTEVHKLYICDTCQYARTTPVCEVCKEETRECGWMENAPKLSLGRVKTDNSIRR